MLAPNSKGATRREFALALAVNHSVLLETVSGRTELCASSPDEQAFVAAGELFGYEYCARDADAGTITIRDKRDGCEYVIELLEVFPYESSRKRMSVVVRLPPDLVAICGGGCPERIYTKGADSVLLTLLAEGSPGSSGAAFEKLNALLYDWADVALRTLVFGKRELRQFGAWHAQYRAAVQSPDEVTKLKSGKPNRITELQTELEAELTLQGATAIEDQLQDGVPEVLADLRSCGIKVWMLTGDKVGTAKNIAAACNILPPTADALEITTETYDALDRVKTADLLDLQERLRAGGAAASAGIIEEWMGRHPDLLQIPKDLQQRREEMAADPGGGTEHCLVIDEKAIELCTTVCPEALRDVGNGCRSVVACRARKDQKAQMLNLIKDGFKNSCCLGIGDGANDVAMIKAGHVGVGIIGKEGREAVNNSDFAIGQFRFLRQLLLVHGRCAARARACG